MYRSAFQPYFRISRSLVEREQDFHQHLLCRFGMVYTEIDAVSFLVQQLKLSVLTEKANVLFLQNTIEC